MNHGTCEVSFETDDYDPVQFYDARFVNARKAHNCTECGGAIAIGERHHRISYRSEGKFFCDRLCVACQEVAAEFEHHVVGGLLWDSFFEQWDEGAHLQACLNRLTTARTKEHMRQQWLRWQETRTAQRKAAIERRQARAAVDPSAADPGMPSTREDSSS